MHMYWEVSNTHPHHHLMATTTLAKLADAGCYPVGQQHVTPMCACSRYKCAICICRAACQANWPCVEAAMYGISCHDQDLQIDSVKLRNFQDPTFGAPCLHHQPRQAWQANVTTAITQALQLYAVGSATVSCRYLSATQPQL